MRGVVVFFLLFHRKRNRYRKRNRSKLSSMEREEKVPRRYREREKFSKSIANILLFLLQTDTQNRPSVRSRPRPTDH